MYTLTYNEILMEAPEKDKDEQLDEGNTNSGPPTGSEANAKVIIQPEIDV